MKFTVIIPSRNRPALFRQALASVLCQSAAAFEVVVVNDGSDPQYADAYRALEQEAAGRARFFALPRTERGHGQSYALNFGAAQARGEYLCFLDDDDEWVDPDYLGRVGQVLDAGGTVDLHLADQKAYVGDRPVDRIVWTEDMPAVIGNTLPADAQGAYTVTAALLLRSHGFCHLNTTIIRKTLFVAMGGFDDNIRYECDRDFYLRAIDGAGLIKYRPGIVSRHNVPDPALKASMSTLVSSLEKHLFQLRVLDKAIVFGRRDAVRRHGRLHKAYALKKIASELAGSGAHDAAAYYAREALLVGFGLKWLAYCLLLWIRALPRRAARGGPPR